jgi:hypothetical protein
MESMEQEMEHEELCGMCHQTLKWHREHKPRHAFVGVGEPARLPHPTENTGPTPTVTNSGMKGDPVLRAVLLRKGMIHEEDLTQMEKVFETARDSSKVVVVSEGHVAMLAVDELLEEITRPPAPGPTPSAESSPSDA